jgi:asparagine synthase (glutamine-hydrolysing)
MCGIAGVLTLDGSRAERDVLQTMTDILAHRGPDGEGQWLNGPVGLGHRRLSIIDLSHQADQPMISSDGKAIIVFNGEIYNYRELARMLEGKGAPCRTQSDTEVILNLYLMYGPGCVTHLRGMFAFAIWDNSKREFFLARDRVGIKPLYYLHSDKAFVFASEIKSIAASGYSSKRINPNAIAGLMRFLVVPQPDTIFSDIRKLEPGRTLTVKADGRLREEVYWQPPLSNARDAEQGEDASVAALIETLRDSVDYHMVSDVPVGAFLSGGLDSSSVVSLMRERDLNQPLDTFSIGFPGQGAYDEDQYARRVASLKNVNYHVDTVDESFFDDLDSIAWHLDEPFAIGSAYATYYLSRHAAKKTKVVLTGDGGDELFAGYLGYLNDTYLQSRARVALADFLSTTLLALARITKPDSRKFNRALTGLARRSGSEGLRYSERLAQNSLYANSMAFKREIFLPALGAWKDNLVARYYNDLSSDDRLRKKLYAEYKTRLVDEMLMKVDRMTMAHSLEARVPLLDHKVVEFAFSLPSELKLHKNSDGYESKYILKRAMEGYLPDDIIYRKKQGFNMPIRNWLAGDFRHKLGDKVINGHLREWGLIDSDGVAELIRRPPGSRPNYDHMLMLLLAFESWADVYQQRLGGITWG